MQIQQQQHSRLVGGCLLALQTNLGTRLIPEGTIYTSCPMGAGLRDHLRIHVRAHPAAGCARVPVACLKPCACLGKAVHTRLAAGARWESRRVITCMRANAMSCILVPSSCWSNSGCFSLLCKHVCDIESAVAVLMLVAAPKAWALFWSKQLYQVQAVLKKGCKPSLAWQDFEKIGLRLMSNVLKAFPGSPSLRLMVLRAVCAPASWLTPSICSGPASLGPQ